MRVLSEGEARSYTRSEVSRLPETVHNVVAGNSGIGLQRLTRVVARSLPKSVETSQVVEWVETILSHLIVRGDVGRRGAGASYLSLPPYAVMLLAEDASDTRHARLHGDARGDARLVEELRQLDPAARIEHTNNGADARIGDPGDEALGKPGHEADGFAPDLSLIDRTLCLRADVATARYDDVAEVMERCGYRLFCLREVATRLPSVHGLLCPPEHELKDVREIGGYWEAYAVSDDRQEPWLPIGAWHDVTAQLVRKRARGDEMAELSRSFYHGGGGMVSDLGREEAVLWPHYLNWLEGRSESAVYSKGTLYLPGNLPPSFVLWLELVVGRRLRQTRRRQRLQLPEGVARHIQGVLEEKLGVKARDSFPKRDSAGRHEKRRDFRGYPG